MAKNSVKSSQPADKTDCCQLEIPSLSVRRFRDLSHGFYEETFQRFPVQATEAGRHEFDSEMGHAGPEVWESHGRFVEKTLAAVEDLPAQDFPAGETLDRRALLGTLRAERLNTVTLRRWENNPQIHLHHAADAIYSLVVRHADDLSPVAGAILSRLRKIPRYLDEAAGCIRRPDPLWKALALKSAPGVAHLYLSLVDELARATGKSAASIRRVAAAAAEAAETYASRVKAVRPALAGSFAIGEERMKLLIHERTGLCLSPREAMAVGLRMAEELAEALRKEARRFHARKSAAEILEEAAAQWHPDGMGLIGAYETTMALMRQRFEEAGVLTFPKGDRLLIRPVPEFMKDQFPTAAYSQPGPFDPDQTGIFWVNDLAAEGMSDAQRAAETAQHFGIELTCAHEAYPGHHLQFIHQNAHPALSRKMAFHAIYYEGWTLWCEQMAADLIECPENPHLRLLQLHDALWRAWRIVIDVGLQTGVLDYDAACGVLQREVGFTRARAEGDVNWYTSMPTVPMSYLLGKAELLRLKHQRVDMGTMSLREFNDWVLSFGAIPWRWIEECGE